jgi:U11/U12 small nuclear ribonucleoprotein SNRNP65
MIELFDGCVCRLRFLGKVLQVQRANKPNDNKKSRQIEESVTKGNAFSTVSTNNDSKSGQILSGEPIAPKLGIDYPFPPHLQYAYPPPDANILANITNALIAVPPLYTQVSFAVTVYVLWIEVFFFFCFFFIYNL